MNYKIMNKSNSLFSLIKYKVLNLDKTNFKTVFKCMFLKLRLISNYIFNNTPYLFNENKYNTDIYKRTEFNNYKDNIDLKLIKSIRTFL